MSISIVSVPVLVDNDRSIDRHIRHREDLDGLRALAALSVVTFHTLPGLPGGGTGVDMFFVLSGYLISRILLRALMENRFSFSDFYARRVKRIFPALLVVLLTVFVVGSVLLLPDEYRRLGKDIATSSAFSLYIFSSLEQAYPVDFDLAGHLLSQLWSLGVEEQFYLLWPLLLLATWRLSKGRMQFVAMAMAVIMLVSLVFLLASDNLSEIGHVPWRGLWELSAGGLLACIQLGGLSAIPALLVVPNWMRAFPRWRLSGHFLSVTAASLLIVALMSNPLDPFFPKSWTLAPAIGTMIFISAGPQSYINKRIFGSAVMVLIGKISYPLYLWHFPVLIFVLLLTWDRHPSSVVMFAIVTISSMVLAFLTYKLVETPLRFNAGRAVVPVLVGLMVACGIIGAAMFLGAISPLSHFRGSDMVRSTAEDWLKDSNTGSWTKYPDGVQVLGRGSRHALFIGDSNMQQYYPRIKKLASGNTSLTRSAIFATRYGCAPGVANVHVAERSDSADCQNFLNSALAYAADPNVDVVVIAAAWYANLAERPDFADVGQVVTPLKPNADLAIEQLKKTVIEFTKNGKRVYLVLNLPVSAKFDPRAHLDRTKLMRIKGKTAYADKSKITAALGSITSKLHEVAKESGATTIDPLELLCDATRCPAHSARGGSMYHDLWHLRPSYVRDHVHYLDRVVLEP